MEPVYIEETEDTPKVILDPNEHTFRFEGNSYPENSAKFYGPLIEWLNDFVEQSELASATFDFNFDYFNTSSAKYILEILRLIEDFKDHGRECLIRWHYFEDDTDMLEAGEDYKDTIDVPFELVMKEDED
jgi:hypothetical protein